MANIIIDGFPNEHNGLKLRTDFKTSMLFELLMQDHELTDEQKTLQAFGLYFDENEILKALENPQNALNTILWFYTRGDSENVKPQNKNKDKPKQIYSFEFDANLIYSAFYETYKIDLTESNMHWWKFKALFEGLSKNCKIMEIMGYRGVDLGKIKDKQEKERYKKLQKLYALPDMRTDEEKQQDFGRAFW